MNEEPNDGLREQIARAESPEEITNLLATAGTFTQASERTRRAWRNTAKRREGELARRQQPQEDRGAVDRADKERREKLALHGMRYSTPISLGGLAK